MKQLLAVAMALVSATAYAAADDRVVEKMLTGKMGVTAEDIRRNYDACDSGNDFSMKVCEWYRWTEQDIRLNTVYEKLRAQMDPGDLPYLMSAQRAWLAYRDAQCEAEGRAGAGGGSEEGLYVLACKDELTRQQADRLNTFVVQE